MKIIEFDKDFKKLENEEFTTIRDHDKGLKLHDIVCIKSPNHEFKAELIGMKYVQFGSINAVTLCEDIDKDFDYWYLNENHSDLLDAYSEFFDDLSFETYVYFYNFKRCS